MAFYISIRKLSETDTTVEYTFGDPEDISGNLRLDKISGHIELLTEAPNDANGSRFQRAARKIWLHWKEGEYPESTCWAS